MPPLRATLLLALAPLLTLGCSIAAAPARASQEDVIVELRAILAAGTLTGSAAPRFADVEPLLRGLYEPLDYAPLWTEDGRPTDAARVVVESIADAGSRGLDPRDYDARLLGLLSALLAEGPRVSDHDVARFDVGTSVALLRLLSDLHLGRVNPKQLRFGFDIDAKKLDLAALVHEAVEHGRIREALADAEPRFTQNRLLQQRLAHYETLAGDASLQPVVIAAKKLEPGDPLEPDVAARLAAWLVALGDLASDAVVASAYDGALVDAVQRFQARHGLDVDGVIGPATSKALAVPAAARAEQIRFALERLRWIPALARGRAVFVNVPAFELMAYDDIASGDPPALQMPVVVGRAARTQTPVFAGAMKTVVFAPYWNVPRSIAIGEILPKLRRGLGYLTRENMEIVRDGQALAPGADAVAQLAAGSARLRQRPGQGNALGRVKFLFPNSNNVYLHDTPSRSLFQRSRRDFSHGCIRVADPEGLARWVLRAEGWDAEAVAAGLVLTREKHVPIPDAIPVVIYYTTAVAHRDGTIAFYADIYGHDAALRRALLARRAGS
jgi:murein L,D-transpeptidase YcbB/YkuD